ncbi:MAG TPA: META domain-containing protein [Planctomycetota bacterium]
MPLLLLLGLLSACLLAPACRAPGADAGAPPTGSWRLVELAGSDLATLARAPELVIEADGKLSGFAGVNRFSGRAVPESLEQGELLAGPLAVTRMAGEPQAMEVEQRFLELLGTRLQWRRRGGELEWLAGGDVRARFVAVP